MPSPLAPCDKIVIKPKKKAITKKTIFSFHTVNDFMFRFVNQSTISKANGNVTACSLPKKEAIKQAIVKR